MIALIPLFPLLGFVVNASLGRRLSKAVSGGLASLDDVRALMAPRASKLAGAIAGRALYDGRLDAAAALALIAIAKI